MYIGAITVNLAFPMMINGLFFSEINPKFINTKQNNMSIDFP